MYICTMKQNHKGKVLFVIIISILLTLCTQNIFAQKNKRRKGYILQWQTVRKTNEQRRVLPSR